MSRFSGIEREGPKAERLPKFTEGQYLLEVLANKVITTQTGDAMVREFKILESAGPAALPAGTEAAAKLLFFSDRWMKARVAEYVRGLTNAATIDAKIAEAIFSEENPAKGKRVRLNVVAAKSEADKDFLRYDFKYVPDDDAKKAKAAAK